MPTASIPSGWKMTSDPTDKTKLAMEDGSDEDFFLSAQLKAGVVTYGIVTKLPGKSCNVRGESLFELMVDWFGKANIQVIRGRWNVAPPGESVNLETFNRLTFPGSRLTEDQAAFYTFTGKMAERKLGFTKVTFDTQQKLGTPGYYTKVVVDFTAP